MALLTNSSAIIAAYELNSLAFSYSIAGFLMSYLIGTYAVLRELGIITDTTLLAGASSGGLLALAHCAGIGSSMEDIVHDVAVACRRKHNCERSLDDVLQTTLRRHLPADAYKRCSGTAFLSITEDKFPSRHPKNILVSRFSSNQDLLQAAAASSYIPVWSGVDLTTKFHGKTAYDGFFSNPQPCPPGVKYCVKISSNNPPWAESDLGKFFQILGRSATLGTGKAARLANSPPGGFKQAEGSSGSSRGPNKEALAAATRRGVDIAPGIWNDRGISADEWSELLVLPGDEGILNQLLRLGRADALAWAQATGLVQAVKTQRASAVSHAEKGPVTSVMSRKVATDKALMVQG